MPDWLITSGRADGDTFPASSTYYLSAMGAITGGTSGLEEYSYATLCRGSYTWSKLYIRVTANATSSSSTLRSKINGLYGDMVVTIGAGLTGEFEDLVHTDNLSSGDLFNFRLSVGSSGSLTVTLMSTILSADTDIPIVQSSWLETIAYNEYGYFPFVGTNLINTSLDISGYRIRTNATFSNMRIHIYFNDLNNSSTLRFIGGTGSMSVTIPASTTGEFEDNTHTEVIAAGGKISYRIDTTASSGDIVWYVTNMKSSSAARQTSASCIQNVDPVASHDINYMTIEGHAQKYPSFFEDVKLKARTSFTAKNLFVYIGSNTLNNKCDIELYDTDVGVSIGAGLSGEFENLVDTADYEPTDYIYYKIDAFPASSGSIYPYYIGFEQHQPTGAGASPSGGMAGKMVAGRLI